MIFLGEKLPDNHQYTFKTKFSELDYTNPSGQRLNALLFTCDDPKGLIYYHHGNAGNMQGWGKYGANFVRLGYDVLFYDYRGYGKSSGKIKKQHQLHDDAQFILKDILENRKYKKLIYYGNSLGTGIASALAVYHEPDALILETPYYNFCDLINYHYPYLPATIMSKYRIRTDKYLPQLKCPILLIHGTDDDIVPYNSSVRLASLNAGIRFVTIQNGVHNNLSDFELYHKSLAEFLENSVNSI